ncbi:DUF4983 domain-containing protein [Niabella pedocola]|uniref:DUF4983 domain-containing protein n=1 Tax=Niabella pedocola TaxID=1752077 RepID=A0ABS8PUB5_9BACT|nr:alkaline phosphatase family protein [Niabella pedocola]MCD2424663.1 DUF4983 domain-containing protein [Niabella pedocola]
MKKIIGKSVSRRLSVLLIWGSFFALASCNKTNNATLTSSTSGEGAVAQKPKVLFIVVDGAMGTEVKAAAPPTLMQMTDHAIYSWDGLTSYVNNEVTNSSTWATLLTGVNNDKHGVTTDLSTANLVSYPTLFTRLKALRPGTRTVSLSSSNALKGNLTTDATVSTGFNGDDAATKGAAVNELKTNDPDFLFVQFHAVDAAGATNGYSNSQPAYNAAIRQTDAYIGELINAVKGRAGYPNENWLIVVTSNKGNNTPFIPVGAAWSAFNDQRHNTFVFYYNPRFTAKATAKPIGILPYAGQTPSYTINGGTAPTNNGGSVPASQLGSLMDFGPGSEFTMQCKVKIPTGSSFYPSFLGKMAEFDDGKALPGFVFFLEGAAWQFTARPTSGGRTQSVGANVMDGQWHTLTGVIRNQAGQRKLIAFTDGVKNTSKDITMSNDYKNPADFVVGWRPGSNGGGAINGILITDIRVYKTALSDVYISNNYCSTEALATDTATSKLVAFWPSLEVLTDGTKNWLKDYSGNNNNIVLKGSGQVSFSETTTRVCPPVSVATYKTVPSNVDALPLIYGWFGISIQGSWSLDGSIWVPSYNDIANQ